MQNLRDISIAELAKKSEGLGLVKSGVNKNEGKGFTDPFTIDETFPVEITGEEITARPSGTPQVAISVSIIGDNGKLQKAGKLWVDLPVAGGDQSAEDEATYMQKSGERFLRFLRAIDPVRFSVFKDIDKSNPKKWVYFDHDGNKMSADERETRAADIDNAVVAVAEGLVDGSVSLVGSQCYVTKRANPNSPKYPYVNFSSAPAQD